jgi:hypothetical protein
MMKAITSIPVTVSRIILTAGYGKPCAFFVKKEAQINAGLMRKRHAGIHG